MCDANIKENNSGREREKHINSDEIHLPDYQYMEKVFIFIK